MSSGAQVLRPYVLRQWRALAGAAGGTAILALAELAKPWPIALIVDHVIANREAPFTPDMGVLLAIGGLILAIAVAETTSTYSSACGCSRRASGSRTSCASRSTTTSNASPSPTTSARPRATSSRA